MKKGTVILLMFTLIFSLGACGSKTKNSEAEAVQEANVDTISEGGAEPNDSQAALDALEGMTFTSEEEIEAYFKENVDPKYGVFESDYEDRTRFIEDEEFYKKSPLEQFTIYIKEINNPQYDNGEKSSLAAKITNIYIETVDENVKEEMDNVIRRDLFKDGSLLYFFPEFNDNEKLVLIALENGGYIIDASERLQHDKEFLRKAMDRHGNGVLACIDKGILTDKDFCLHLFRKGYLEVYNRLIDEVSYSNDEKAKALLEDKEIITAVYESMQIMEFENLKDLDYYINEPENLANELFGLFSEDFRAKRLEFVLEFNNR